MSRSEADKEPAPEIVEPPMPTEDEESTSAPAEPSPVPTVEVIFCNYEIFLHQLGAQAYFMA